MAAIIVVVSWCVCVCVPRRRISFCKSSADDGARGGGGRLLFGHSTRLSLVSSQWEPGNDKDNGHHEQTAGGRGDDDDSLGQQLSREEEDDDSFREQLFFDEIEDDSFREQLSYDLEEDSYQRRYIG